MEEMKEDVPLKAEVKEESLLLPFEYGTKEEHGEISDTLVDVSEEDKYVPETKPPILTSLVKNCSVRIIKSDINLLMNKMEKKEAAKKNYEEKLSSGIDVVQTANSVTEEEEFSSKNNDTHQLKEDFPNLEVVHLISKKSQTHKSIIKKKYVKERKFICRYCNKGFPQSDILLRHERTHTGERPYECSYCHKRFISVSLLKRHMTNHTGKKFTCSICYKLFFQSQGLKTHMLIHEDKKPFKCTYCNFPFRQTSGLVRHIRRVHTPPTVYKFDDGQKSFKCNYCNFPFRQKCGLVRHIRRVHTPSPVYKFDDGQKSLPREKVENTGKKFCCLICNKLFLQSQGLKKHMLIHEDKKPFKCTYCNFPFCLKSGLVRHIRRVHTPPPVYKFDDGQKSLPREKVELQKCEEAKAQVNNFQSDYNCTNADCGIIDIAKNVFSKNLGNVNPDKSFTCDDCGKSFETRCNIVSHMKTVHLPSNRYCCNICGRACTSKTNLKKHENLHKNVYPFKCVECGMSFKEKGGVRNHLLTSHTNEKQFKCEHCDCSFKDKQNLISHIEVHHRNDDITFACHICKMEFKRMCYLKRHSMIHTGEDKTHECADCGLRCRSKTDIAKHVLTHLGAVEKPHICDVCGASFSKASHLVRHKGVHSDKRTFCCQLCDKAYKDPSSLKIHHESVHCGASFSCKACGFLSTNRQSFNRHLRNCFD